MTLGVSGMLWEANLVMVDQETGSLWSQMMGQAMRGPLTGTKLENIPARMTDWQTWKEKYPHTTVLIMSRTSARYDRSFLGPDRGIGIGLVAGGQARYWSYSRLNDNPVINDQLGELRLLVVIERQSLTPAIYSRQLGDRELSFALVDGQLTDVETNSVWDLLTGVAIEGDLKGQTLAQLPGFTSDAAVWSLYFPATTWWAETPAGAP